MTSTNRFQSAPPLGRRSRRALCRPQGGRAAAAPAADGPLRIGLLSYRSNPYSGGQGIYIHYLSKALAELGHRVEVIAGEPYPELAPGVGFVPLPGMNLYHYASVRAAVRERGLSSPADLLECLSYASGGFPEPWAFGRRLLRHLPGRLAGYDIVHDNQSLSTGLLALRRKGIPLLATIHHPITKDLELALRSEPEWGMRLLIRRWHRFLKMQKRVAARLPSIITVSEASKRDLAADFCLRPERIEVVPNGVDLETFRPDPKVRPDPWRIMSAASADVPLKGLATLLRALAALRDDFPRVHLAVLGKPKANGPTKKLIQELRLEDRVSFLNGLSSRQLAREYARSSLAVIPSLYEGFGLPAAEAMACGLPVVATTGGALPEVVGDAGILVPGGDSRAMAEAIRRLLPDPVLRRCLGQDGRRRMERLFTWRRCAEQTVSAYRRALSEAGSC